VIVSSPSPPHPLPGLADLPPLDRPVLHDIAVVIPTLGRDILDNVLASMVGGTAWPERIIVVDQSDGRRVAEMLGRAQALGVGTLRVTSAPRGRAAALNLGIAQVDARYLAITDDDCVVAHDWLETMRSALVEHPGTIVSGQVLEVGEEAPVAVVLRRTAEVRTRPSLTFDLLVGGNCGMPKELFVRIGPYDEDPRVALAEDTEYAYRALRAGARLGFVPEIRVWHYAWRDAGQRERQFRGYARSHGAFYGKYLRQFDTLIAAKASIHLARACRRWIRATIAGDENLAAHGRAYTLQLVPGIIEGLRSPWEDRIA
jgi:GT2 family glycosyltransferase